MQHATLDVSREKQSSHLLIVRLHTNYCVFESKNVISCSMGKLVSSRSVAKRIIEA